MLDRITIGAAALAAALLTTWSGARAIDEAKYPDLKGQWIRVGTPRWVIPGQKAPLTPEYQAVFEANRAEKPAADRAMCRHGTACRKACR